MQQFNWQTAAERYAPIWKSHHHIISFNFMCFAFFPWFLNSLRVLLSLILMGYITSSVRVWNLKISLQNSARIAFTIENHHRYYLLKVTFFNLKGSFMILIGTECHVNLSYTLFLYVRLFNSNKSKCENKTIASEILE